MDSPWLYVAALVVAPFIYRMWWKDYKAQQGGEMIDTALPGATPVAMWVTIMAVLGALAILAVEVAGEYAIGVVEDQTEMTLIFSAYSILVASVLEEMIFRGFLFVDKSKAALIGSIVGISVLFAVIHPYIWTTEAPEGVNAANSWEIFEGTWLLYGPGPLLTTGILFIRSLWLYAVRFMPANPRHSLIPCFMAHMVANLGVVVVKGMQGKLTLAWIAS